VLVALHKWIQLVELPFRLRFEQSVHWREWLTGQCTKIGVGRTGGYRKQEGVLDQNGD
jgi:hypothetical protein